MATDNIHLYMIAYSPETLQVVQRSDFKLLDNTRNERPDWYEYWPIRNFLLNNQLDSDGWYGFFSPKFTDKTSLSYADVWEFVDAADRKVDAAVALFCPQPDMGANFLNVFEQAEVFDPGFIDVAEQFLSSQGIQLSLRNIVMDSRQIVFSNYFVARSAFWCEWFRLAEALFAKAEDFSDPLAKLLSFNTTYSANANRKVFLLERLASLLLYIQPQFNVAVANPFGFGWSMAKFRETPHDTYINDALKRAFRDTGFPQYMDAFRMMRDKLMQ